MKKSIVLLITLLFISALSALILKNLSDTQVYVDEQSSKIIKFQSLSIIENLKNEVSKIILKNKDFVDEFIEANSQNFYPLKVKDVDILFKVKLYDKINLNKLNSQNKNEKQEIIDSLNDLDIYNIDNLRYILKNNKIESNKQLDNILSNFIKDIYDDKILEVRNKLGFIDTKNQNFYELIIKLKIFKELVNAYYILNKEGQVKYFELSFK